jgi:hypothetical protein
LLGNSLGTGAIARSFVNKMAAKRAHPTFNVQATLPRVASPSLPPRTPTRSKNEKETDSDETDSDETDSDETDSDETDTYKRDPKNLTFDEYVNGDAGHVDGDETLSYDYGEVNVEETERSKKVSKLMAEEINKMKAEYSEKYHKICPENKWKLPSGKFAEDILYEYTLNLEYERYLS